MRAVTAKKLRRLVYGDSSPRMREYGMGKRIIPGTKTEMETGARVNRGLRAQYLEMKRIYKTSLNDTFIERFVHYLREVGNKWH